MTLLVPLVRWTRPDGRATLIHILDDELWRRWTRCGIRTPLLTVRVTRSTEPLELAREYPLCARCRRAFGVPLVPTNPHRRRRRRPIVTRSGVIVTQLTL